ncbi:MAG: hypothetical protein ACYC9N_14925, partial [Thermoanaerobaculia bacterium]
MRLSDELLTALAAVVAGLAFALAARWHKRLELTPASLGAAAAGGTLTGAATLALHPFGTRIVTDSAPLAILFILASWIQRRDADLDATDAALAGSFSGLAAAAIVLPVSDQPLHDVVRLGAAGPIAVTAAWFAVSRSRAAAWAGGAALLAALAALANGIPPRIAGPVAIAVCVGPAIAAFASVLRLRGTIASELAEETRLGVFDAAEVVSVAHPIHRLRFRVWPDAVARRRFVQIATELAIRKRQQRRMSPEAARLYQLEILKLRMELQHVVGVHHSVQARL